MMGLRHCSNVSNTDSARCERFCFRVSDRCNDWPQTLSFGYPHMDNLHKVQSLVC